MKIATLFSFLPLKIAYAHCDVPCGIYDPHQAQIGALSVLRMTQMILEAEKEPDSVKREHHIARLTRVKEDHAEIVKHEVRVIWGDYFKEEHLKDYPDLHKMVFEIMKAASKTRQTVDMEAAKSLLSKVQEFAEIFYKTKGVTPKRVKALPPITAEIVVYE